MCSGSNGAAALMAADNNLLKEQAQQRRLQQARLPATQSKANAADKPLFGPPIQVLSTCTAYRLSVMLHNWTKLLVVLALHTCCSDYIDDGCIEDYVLTKICCLGAISHDCREPARITGNYS